MKISIALVAVMLLLLLLSERFPEQALMIAGLVFLGALINNVGTFQNLMGRATQ